MKTKVYDKVSWHYPDGDKCSSLDVAKIHFEVIMEWLDNNGFLNDYGKEIYELGVGSDFSITSEMLTDEGNKFLGKYYDKWLGKFDYGEKPSTDFLDNNFNN